LLGRDLRRTFAGFPGICLVEHQLTARMLSDVCRVWFLHADVAAPPECAINGPERIFVPLEYTAEGFRACLNGRQARGGKQDWGEDHHSAFSGESAESFARRSPERSEGSKTPLRTASAAKSESGNSAFRIPHSALSVTGLMIEPDLIPESDYVFSERVKRAETFQRPVVGFFTSGAYPAEHVRRIMLGIESVIEKGFMALLFCGTDRRFYDSAVKRLGHLKAGMVVDDGTREEPWLLKEGRGTEARLFFLTRPDRISDTALAVNYVPHLDVFVAAAHERVNWALGLGLPLFALFPMIGTHSRMNYEFAEENGVAQSLETDEEARDLGPTILELQRSGTAAAMVQNGFGKFDIHGAEHTAEEIIAAL
jgi:hypothetical protein